MQGEKQKIEQRGKGCELNVWFPTYTTQPFLDSVYLSFLNYKVFEAWTLFVDYHNHW